MLTLISVKQKITKNISLVFILLLACFLVFKLFNSHRYRQPEKVIANDVISYYAYLPATFIEHDYTLNFMKREHRGTYWPEILEDGTRIIKTSMGLSIMYCPFFLVANVLASPLGYDADGFTVPYAFALSLACLFYLIVGCLFLRKVLIRYFSELTTALTLLIVTLCTNLYWYTIYEPAMSHAFSFALICVFLFLTERWHEKPAWGNSIFLGLIVGLISLVRPTNGIVVLYFLLYNVFDCKTLKDKIGIYLRNVWKIGVVAVAAILVWLPQIMYWHSLTGHIFFYSYTDNEGFFFSHPVFLRGLFGFRKGWLLYTPSMILGVAGIVLLFRRFKEYSWAVSVFMFLNLYIMLSWWCWWYGGSCGLRAAIDSYGIMAIPMAVFIAWIGGRTVKLKIPLVCIAIALSGLSFFHNLQYKHGSIHWDSMTRAAYINSFGHLSQSENFENLLQKPDYAAAKQGDR